MKNKTIFFILFIMLCGVSLRAEQIKDYFEIDYDEFSFPVLVRGNLDKGKILLFVQGGPGETAIDFARADYPKWKNTLETKVAIAYYDQRGLNQKASQIDTTKITYLQYGKDLLAIAKRLKEKYKADIYLMGHSAGGNMVQNCLENFSKEADFISGAILLNTPITNDYSPERYKHYRPLYLQHLAEEMLGKGIDTLKWREAHNWIMEIDSIETVEQVRKWNAYVDSAFKPSKRKISVGMALKVVFAKPYGLFKYMNRKDDELVGDFLWADGKNLTAFQNLSYIKQPILLLTGRFDDIASPEEMKEAHRLIPNSKLVVMPNAGHESFLDQPVLFEESILGFISE